MEVAMIGQIAIDVREPVLRLSVDREWPARDMANHFAALDDLYNFEVALFVAEGPRDQVSRSYAVRQVLAGRSGHFFLDGYDLFELTVARIQFSSPGFQDFLGVGRALKEVRELVQWFVNLKQEREKHELTMRQEEEKLEAFRLKNLKAKLALLKNAGLTKREVAEVTARWLRAESEIAEAVEAGRIVEAKIVGPGGG
jgi:hypothetical protein